MLLRPASCRPVWLLELVLGLMSVGAGLTLSGCRAEAAVLPRRGVLLPIRFLGLR